MSIKIAVCGPKEFIETIINATQGTDLIVAGTAGSSEELLQTIGQTDCLGVIAPAGGEWAEILIVVSKIKKDVTYFASGSVTREMWARLMDNRILLLAQDSVRAVRDMALSLERISPTAIRYNDAPMAQVKALTDPVSVVKHTTVLSYSIKGGVGKTTLTANLAAAAGMWARDLKRKSGQDLRVAVIDNNPDGNIKNYLGFALFDNYHRARSIISFQTLNKHSSYDEVNRLLNYHIPSNVYFVSSPETLIEKRQYSAQTIQTCLDLITRYFNCVFIDMGVHLDDDSALVAADYATDILLVSDTDPMTVSLLASHRNEIIQMYGGIGRFKLVLNQRDREADHINSNKAVEILEIPFAAELPFCAEIKKSLKNSMPVVCEVPNDRYSLEIASLSKKLIGIRDNYNSSGKDRSIVSRLFQKKGI